MAARASKRRRGTREKLIGLLNFRAEPRACEIAGLDWTMVATARGEVSAALAVDDSIAKNGQGRRMPVHFCQRALKLPHEQLGRPRSDPVIPSRYGRHLKPGSIVNWFGTISDELDLPTHSEARGFIFSADLDRTLLDDISAGVSLCDEPGTIVYTNPAEHRMFGYAAGELLGQHFSVQNAYPPDEDARTARQLCQGKCAIR